MIRNWQKNVEIEQAKKLKRLNLNADKKKKCILELKKIDEQSEGFKNNIRQLIERAVDNKLFPNGTIRACKNSLKRSNKKGIKGTLNDILFIKHFDEIKNNEIKNKIQKLLNKMNLLTCERRKILVDKYNFEWDYNGNDFIPPEPVRLITTEAGLLPYQYLGLPGAQTPYCGIKNDSLSLCIDLTYDKTELLEIIGETITDAQKIIGKRPGKGRRSKAYYDELYKLVKRVFIKHYKNAKTAAEAINKTIAELGENSPDEKTIRRKYLNRIRNEYGVTKTEELKNLL